MKSNNPLLNRPKFIGAPLSANVVGVALKDGLSGRQIVVDIELVITKDSQLQFPAFVSAAMKPGNDVRQIVISTDKADVGMNGCRELDRGDAIKIENGTIATGVHFKYGGIRGTDPCAFVKFTTSYLSSKLKWFADHLQGSPLEIVFFDLESEQTKLAAMDSPPAAPTKSPRKAKAPRTTEKAKTDE